MSSRFPWLSAKKASCRTEARDSWRRCSMLYIPMMIRCQLQCDGCRGQSHVREWLNMTRIRLSVLELMSHLSAICHPISGLTFWQVSRHSGRDILHGTVPVTVPFLTEKPPKWDSTLGERQKSQVEESHPPVCYVLSSFLESDNEGKGGERVLGPLYLHFFSKKFHFPFFFGYMT